MTIFKDKKIYVLDGAMGTQIMKSGVKAGLCFESLNLTRPDIIYKIHKSYIEAGADVIETNTFGGTKIKLTSYGLEDRFHKINFDAVRIAKNAAAGRCLVMASMGPHGELMEPIGGFSFDQAYDEFSAQAKVFEEAGADLVSIETMGDIQEARAALIAVKQNTKLPVIIHLTYAENGKTITGTPPAVACAVFEALGADAIGANCSTGPQGLVRVAKLLKKHTKLPVSIMANAGNPEIVGDETVYRMTPEKFSKYAKELAKIGVKFIGGCCGTSPDHIRAIFEIVKNPKSQILNPKQIPNSKSQTTRLSSRTEVLEIKERSKIVIIGERINPTNRKDIQQDLKEGKTNIIRRDAVSQVASGADMLDINVGFPETDEVSSMKKAVLTVQSCTSVPVCLDSADPAVLEEGLKNYAGKALVNSVNAKEESLNAILPLAKKYGAAVIGLTLDKSGIKSGAKDRFDIAKKIVGRAIKEGIPKEDVFIDVLTLSAGAQQKDVLETLKAVKMVASKLKVKTSLGVSNVSHGLPGRKLLNAAFLILCKEYGLSAAIYNPENLKIKLTAKQYKEAKAVFLNKDKGAGEWIQNKIQSTKPKIQNKSEILNPKTKIKDAVIEGDKDNILGHVEEALRTSEAQSIIDDALLPGIEEVGRRFNTGEYFIPQVMASAETMKTAFERVKKEIKVSEQKNIGTVVIATVLGDIHDIGKNIVSMLLENHGFRVIDLGKDVPPEKIISSAKENKADIIFLSALLTTTMPQMKAVKQALEKEGLNIPIIIGGAPVTQGYASSFGAGFAKDAIEAVERAKVILTS